MGDGWKKIRSKGAGKKKVSRRNGKGRVQKNGKGEGEGKEGE